jgi:hypothetical protein
MPQLHTITIEETIAVMPDVESFDASTLTNLPRIDCLLCTLGFEDRSVTFPELFASGQVTASNSIYLEYATNVVENRTKLPRLLTALGRISPTSISSLSVDDSNFHETLRLMLEAKVGGSGLHPHVVLDISAAAARAILKVLRVLLAMDLKLTITYAEADIYHPTKEEFEAHRNAWIGEEALGLERGVSEVTIPLEFSGEHLETLTDCVIIFPAFKRERSMAVLDRIEPSLVRSMDDRVVWILGSPPALHNQWREQAIRLIHEIPSDCPQYSVSTIHYKKTVEILEAIYRERELRAKFSISPLGSKFQAVGVAFFHSLHPDVRVLFAIPSEYGSTHYSEGSGAKWSLSFDTLDIRTKLGSVGCISIVD